MNQELKRNSMPWQSKGHRGTANQPSRPGKGLPVSSAIWCFAAITLLALGCSPQGPSPLASHPNEANEPPPNAARIQSGALPVGLDPAALGRWTTVRAAFLEAETVLAIGSGQKGPDLFGYVPMADIDENGNIVVLDEDAQDIRIFDANGQFIESFGGRGEGPLELRRAHTLVLLPGGRIAVGLGVYGPIKVFARDLERWHLANTIDFRPTPAHSLCVFSDGQMFGTGFQHFGNDVIFDLSDSISGMGTGYLHPESVIRQALSGGLADCVDASQEIVFGFELQPILRSYGLDGSLRWTAVVTDYLQLMVDELAHPRTGAPGYSERVDRDHDRLFLVAATHSGEHVLAQYGRVIRDRKTILPISYLIDGASGAGASLGDQLPHILSVQRDGYIALFEGPEVHLEIRKFKKPQGIE